MGLQAVTIEPSAEGDLEAFVDAGLHEDTSADLRDFESCELGPLVETILEKPEVFEGLEVLELPLLVSFVIFNDPVSCASDC